MTQTRTRTRRVEAPADDDVIYADEHDEPGTKAGFIEGVVGYDPDRQVWLTFTDTDKLVEVQRRRDSDSWDYVNKFWEPEPGKEKGVDSDYWHGAPEAVGKWLRGEV